jgi:hypothetical protein
MQATTISQPGEFELRRLGYEVTVSGDLAALRAKTRLTKNTMARMLGINIGALTGYEALTRAISKDVALRIGEWYWGATTALAQALAFGVPVHAMIPAAQAAQYLNMPLEYLEIACHYEVLRAELIGVMGWYLHADELPGLTAHTVARGLSLVAA